VTGYDSSAYPSFAVTVDLAVFTVRDGVLSVLLVERAEDPYAGSWALPGGFVGAEEDAEAAAWRELSEETGVPRFAGHLEQLRTYSRPDRDPRMRVVSVAHVAFAPRRPEPTAGSDARNARWWAVSDVLEGPDRPPLAFDHEEILGDAVERVRSKIEYTTLATEFVTEPFTIADLHRVYTAVWGVAPDLGNFRRKVMKTSGFVVPTEEKAAAEPTGGPRPLLFRRGEAVTLQPAMLRPGD
jgi:8-oxo-dGTP diphosphatase